MSASLVGSEMCIRDRAQLAASLSQLQTCWNGSVRRKRLPRAQLPTCMPPCLLYTSDAADDM
eukprot:11347745-Alexandrium_andersonii.AAC.1